MVVLDVMMPDVDGREVLRRLRAHESGRPGHPLVGLHRRERSVPLRGRDRDPPETLHPGPGSDRHRRGHGRIEIGGRPARRRRDPGGPTMRRTRAVAVLVTSSCSPRPPRPWPEATVNVEVGPRDRVSKGETARHPRRRTGGERRRLPRRPHRRGRGRWCRRPWPSAAP